MTIIPDRALVVVDGLALAQQLRNILAVEQEHAMDLMQALGK